jgi:hypothetical protein
MPSVPLVSLGKSLTQVVHDIAFLGHSQTNTPLLNQAAVVGSPIRLSDKSATPADLENLRKDVERSLHQLRLEVHAQLQQIQAQIRDLGAATLDSINLLQGKIFTLADIEKQLATALNQEVLAGEAAQLISALNFV